MTLRLLAITFFLSLSLLSSAKAGGPATGGASEISTILNGLIAGAGVAKEAGTFVLENKDSVKEFVLDPAARVLGQRMIQEMQKSTIDWINSGLDGNGPSFIANPKVFYRNVANEEIRIQLSTIDKNSVLSGTVAGTIIAGVRGDRKSLGAQLQVTLPSDIQRSVCNDATLTELARSQINTGLSTTNQTGVSDEARLAQIKRDLSRDLCSANALSDRATQERLLNCFKNDVRCGGWNALLASFDPKNTEYGQAILAQQLINKATEEAVTEIRSQVSDGVAPKRKCRARLEVDDEGNRYPNAEAAPCINWVTETPTAQIKTVLTQAVQGDFTGLQDADEISEVITGLAVSQLTGMFTTAVQSAFSGSGSNSNQDTLFNDPRYRGALPPSLIERKESGSSLPLLSQSDLEIVTKARGLCSAQGERYPLYKRFCTNLASNDISEKPYTRYLDNITSYSQIVEVLGACVVAAKQKTPEPKNLDLWEDAYEDRKGKIDVQKTKAEGVLQSLPKSILLLSKYIVLLEEKGEVLLTQVLEEYGNSMNDNLIVLQGVEEGVYEQAQQLKQQADKDVAKKGELTKAINECRVVAGQCLIQDRGGNCIKFETQSSAAGEATTTPPFESTGGE